MTHLSAFNHFDLEASPEGELVEWYNVQFYCGWGDASSPNGYLAMVNAGWDPKRLVLGVPTNREGCGGNGWHSLSVLERTIGELNRGFGTSGWGGVMGWEYFGAGRDDGVKSWEWAGALGKLLGRTEGPKNLGASSSSTAAASSSDPPPLRSGTDLPVPPAPEAATANINATIQAENAIAANLPARPAPERSGNEPNEANISRLVEMGFERAEAVAALEAMGGDVDGAAGLLFGD
jgi:hypothetical protein